MQSVSALSQFTFSPLLDAIEKNIWENGKFEERKMRNIRNLVGM